MSRLERWSRLKRNVQTEEDVSSASLPAAEPRDETTAEQHVALDAGAEDSQPEDTQAQPELEPEPGSLDHTLPDPDTLEAGSDFSAFMVPGVSGALRRRALKRLWATGNYNVRDGLDDYDADYRQQLKPMASELASKLRRWTHKVEEAVDKDIEGNNEVEAKEEVEGSQEVASKQAEPKPEPQTRQSSQKESPINEQGSGPLSLGSEDASTSCTSSNNEVKTRH